MTPWVRENIGLLMIITLLGVAGAVIILHSSTLGPWVGSDSVGYLENARNFLSGRGLGIDRASGEFRHLSFHPPLYSLVLSAGGFAGLDLLDTARWLNVLLFAIAIISLGIGTLRLTHQPILAISLSALFLTSPSMVNNFSGAMAEPLFFSSGILGILLLLFYLRDNEDRLLNLSAIALGLSALGRYTGVTFIAASLISLFILQTKPMTRRIRIAATYAIISGLPLLLWLGTQYFIYPESAPGIFNFRLGSIWQLTAPLRVAFVEIPWDWLPYPASFPPLSYRFKLVVQALFLLLLSIFTFRKIQANREGLLPALRQNPSLALAFVFAIFTLAYVVFLSLAYLVVVTPLIDRIFSPIYVGGMLAIVSIACWIVSRLNWGQMLIPFVVVPFLIANIRESTNLVSNLHYNGVGYTSAHWQSSGVIDALLDLPDAISLISNDSAAIMFYSDRVAHEIPELSRASPLESFHRFGDSTNDNVERIFREDGAALILFDSFYWQLLPIYYDEASDRLQTFTNGLNVYTQVWDGAIYFFPTNAE